VDTNGGGLREPNDTMRVWNENFYIGIQMGVLENQATYSMRVLNEKFYMGTQMGILGNEATV